MSWQTVREIKARLTAEQDTIVKEWGGKLPVALIYPNSYYIGMSNLGIQAIYRFINNYPDAVCERVFREPKYTTDDPPLAMESQRPLTDFAVLGFSVSYELDYFNVVQILKAGGIPLYAKDRNETHPLVIAGGPCITANPLPLSPFFDCLCIGEAEAILPKMLPIMKVGISEKRDALLKKLATLPGVYVPCYTSKPVVRQWVADLDKFPVHSSVLTRDTELGDMYLIEVERGCNWGCRFCLVTNVYKPMRFRSIDSLLEQAKFGLQYRKRLGLMGPAVTDHPRIDELVAKLHDIGAEISVSSLRIKPLSPVVLGEVIEGGTNTVALAPEAGSQRLRDVINKGIDEDDILRAVGKVALQGIKQLKLYFMIGLPTETDEDIEGIAQLVTKCKELFDKQQSWSRITLTIAPFVPKAGTPFQRLGMESLNRLKHRLSLLKSKLPSKGISVKNESLEWNEVQAVLSRGDERLAEVLANMENLSLAEWRQAMKKTGLDIDFYAHMKWGLTQKLPWAVIDSVTKKTINYCHS
ncbi:MAG: radical SAM protein [Chloroflexi bacterium]|nr:radical SAM protein [Chloroflexota bacterium]